MSGVRCIVCGGGHEPHPILCDEAGMDEQARKMGARRWNRITAQINNAILGPILKPLLGGSAEQATRENLAGPAPQSRLGETPDSPTTLSSHQRATGE
jgi:hypothetical protein